MEATSTKAALKIGEYHNFKLGHTDFHIETLQSLAMVNLIIFLLLGLLHWHIKRRQSKLLPGGLQNVAELMVGFINDIVENEAGPKGLKYAPLVGTVFVFIFFCNYFALVPWSHFYHLFFAKWAGEMHEIIPPTMDINTTLALALCGVMMVHIIGVREKGWGYFKHLFVFKVIPNPLAFIEELARPFSLTVRLFANLFAHETIIMVLLWLVAVPLIYPVPIALLGMITGFIQAYVFALLIAHYLSAAVSDHH